MALRLGGLLLVASTVFGQTDVTDSRTTLTGDSTIASLSEVATPTGPYQTFTSQITLSDQSSSLNSANVTQIKVSKTSDTVTYLTGSATTTFAGNFSATSSIATPTVTNTRPCNNYPEFCFRKYSNITEIACHNSPFITKNNLAANQLYDVTAQLNDGVRFLQAQIQWPANGTEPHFCHTSCDILDAGPITDWLTEIKTWVAAHPYDVVTILLGNGNYSVPSMYVPYIESTGILNYIYTPPLVPMTLNDWPTLSEMILGGERVVMFLDYMADQIEYPWLMDEFSQMWETAFDPVNQSFPCDVQRPPDLSEVDAKNRLYLHNHNLNLELSILGAAMLVPARTELNVTNNATGFGSLGSGAENCENQWGRAPNFLNVDYYNYGGYPGSVFEVAAKYNNVTYSRSCCGKATSGAFGLVILDTSLVFGIAIGLPILQLLWN
ncbi:PLC-like phosphodiesterase [Pseudomassariella vexata]|uniref:PLC-like phosphodiesterase n=1 Tax=Pseudomassariella vexata TaxID=1141098 RepID=A0A1Y2DWP6_9PEZI|nr:PLC-like phosphodiesterase [Pseudomassariella vexata]ORY63045.1 PLC-like phosphodiesterase [Pseudomassariella vexata]